MGKLSEAVVVFAREPVLGKVKTRLAKKLGNLKALSVYMELINICAQTVKGFEHFVSYPESDCGIIQLKNIFPGARGFIAQRGDDLKVRVKNTFIDLQAKGFTNLCAVGTDTPSMDINDIDSALGLLRTGYDSVIGPAYDGGFYLIAVSNPSCKILDADSWETPKLLEDTLYLAEQSGLKCALLKKRNDIDTDADYNAWKNL